MKEHRSFSSGLNIAIFSAFSKGKHDFISTKKACRQRLLFWGIVLY
ncbi:MAG: hypothetical protein H6695_06955 [Deferribacteres bacterium]|nr:hypothetical protein [Deferribacteres bacterium]